MPINYPQFRHLGAQDVGGFGGVDLMGSIRAGLQNANAMQEARFKPQIMQGQIRNQELLNKINEAKAQYAGQKEEAAINQMAAQTALSQGNLSLIPYYKQLYSAQAQSAAAKAKQAQEQERIFESIRNGTFRNQSQPAGTQEQQPQDYMSALRGQELPQGQGPLANQSQPQVQNNNLLPGGVNPDDILRGLSYKAYGLTAPTEGHTLTGAARDAESMKLLRDKYGANSDIVKTAEAQQKAETQRKEDLSEIRHRQLNGLKPGDTEIKDPNTGETIGFRKQTTEKQKESAKNTALFNSIFPYVYKGGAPFSGTGAASKLYETIKRAKTDPKAKQELLAFMIADKALTNTTITEAARFQSGKTNQVYNRYADSLKTENIHPKLKKWLKEYGIASEMNLLAGQEWQRILNASEKNANERIPATMDYYFNPEKQFEYQQKLANQNESLENNNVEPDNTITKNGKTFKMINGEWYELR